MNPVVFSGFKPSGKLHIGNYLGAIKPSLDLLRSGKYDCFYSVVDYHALTQKYLVEEKRSEIRDMFIDLLALGIDPGSSAFFIQSQVTEHANLAWILNNLTPVGKLGGMIEYREKLSEGQSPNAGLFTYPILMAADIALYKTNLVPVGEDQRQHLELCREIIRTFNDRFGKTFPEPVGLFVGGLRVKSLDNPEKKMSKSLPQGCLYLTDPPEIIRKKIRVAVTDSGKEIIYSPEDKPAVSNLLLIYSEFSGEKISDLQKKYKGKSYSEFKDGLAETLVKTLEPFQEKRRELAANQDKLKRLMEKGREKASAVAQETLAEVKEKIGLIL